MSITIYLLCEINLLLICFIGHIKGDAYDILYQILCSYLKKRWLYNNIKEIEITYKVQTHFVNTCTSKTYTP